MTLIDLTYLLYLLYTIPFHITSDVALMTDTEFFLSSHHWKHYFPGHPCTRQEFLQKPLTAICYLFSHEILRQKIEVKYSQKVPYSER